MTEKEWEFITQKDRRMTAASTTAGVLALGVLSLTFAPLGPLLGLGYVAFRTYIAKEKFRKKLIKEYVEEGKYIPVSNDEPMAIIAAEISTQLGRPQTPDIYIEKGNNSKTTFSAMPGTNTIVTTRAALDNEMTEPEMRFTAAHEISHLQTDSKTITARIGMNFFSAKLAALIGVMGAFAAGAGFFVTAQLGVGIIGAAMFGSAITLKMAEQLNIRIIERRADRNALYITRDIEAAKSDLSKGPMGKNKRSRLVELFLDHPSYVPRVKAMTKAFSEVSKYPPLQTPANAPVPVQLQKTNAPQA